MQDTLLSLQHITKNFGEGDVLRDISLDVARGEFVTLLGASGCGKTTTLRIISGLETPDEGTVLLDGKDVTALPPERRPVNTVFQSYALFPHMNVEKNVAYGLRVRGMDKASIAKRVREMLELVQMEDYAKRMPSQLSGGQRQRIAIARALAPEPELLLLDEPLSAIDALLRRNLQVEIRRIQKKLGITTLFVTHDQDEAMVMSDRIHLFNVGTIEQSGAPVELYTQPKTKFAATFIGHYNIVDAAIFDRKTGMDHHCDSIAIRPEIIGISTTLSQMGEAAVSLEGQVVGSLSHGNILRYTVDFGEFQLDVDILFDASMMFKVGDMVHVMIGKESILELY